MLCNVVRKPIEVIFREFLGTARDQAAGGAAWSASGDVKYHLGTAYDRSYPDGRKVRIELLPNPSHLEAVNPLVVGKARARMDAQGDARGDAVLPVIVHGDAAFAGQGVVYETMQMVALEAYGTGGTIHVICNNQVGFTATPEQGRSTMYASDLGKAFGAPIFHVNADDPEAVCRVFETAVAWRHEFKTDVIVDLVGYRKFGHNEIDEPTFTQPMMYAKVRTQPSVLTKYLETVAATEPVVPAADVARIVAHVDDVFARAFEAKDTFTWDRDVWGQNWQKIVTPADVGHGAFGKTGASPDALAAVGAALSTVPDGFKLHRRLRGRLAGFAEAVASGEGVDWALGEALAFGTLLLDGMPIRFTGQDVQRGTFTHRHAVVHDQDDGREYCFVNHIHADQPAKLAIHNSFLSEYGVLGFELGYSYESPDVLCIWEAQFGDFANCAQAVFDQFISAGEAKWLRQSGLVVALPHGYDGQGPEHSSARIERFLQMSLEDPFEIAPEALEPETQQFFEGRHLGTQVQNTNWQVVYPTTPAQYFHVLRRQVHREFRKPLILFTSKMLLRHPQAKDSLTHYDDDIDNDDLGHVRFKRLIMDSAVKDRSAFPPTENGVKKVLFCSGQVYYKVRAERDKAGLGEEIHMVRVEQLAPFPFDLVLRELRRYPLAERVWLQEEPKNMGPYLHVMPRFDACVRALGGEPPGVMAYAGRPVASSPATGFAAQHLAEERALAAAALALP